MKALHFHSERPASVVDRKAGHGESDGRHDAPGSDGQLSTNTGVGSVLASAIMALINYLLLSGGMILLTRHVYNMHSFGDYSATVSAITVAATAATLGLEKYFLKIVPGLRVLGDFELLRGFRSFAPAVVCLVTMLVAGVLLVIWTFSPAGSAMGHSSFLIGIAFLPAVVLVCYLIEVLTADGAFVFSILLYRIFLPSAFIVGILLMIRFDGQINGNDAVLNWGICWGAVLCLFLLSGIRFRPKGEGRGRRSYQPLVWVRHSTAFLGFSLLMSLMANGGVLVLGFMPDAKQETALFAVVVQLAGLMVLISTASNRWYGPQISAALALSDFHRIDRLFRSRFMVILALVMSYQLFLLIAGEWALGLFGSEYRKGWAALLILGCGFAFSSMFSIFGIYLQYSGREWTVPVVLAIGVVVLLLLAIPGAIFFGVIGVACACSLALALTYGVLALMTRRLRRDQRKGARLAEASQGA